MKIFVSDLDNTLIYSYKKNIGLDKILVESKDGKELSFMSKYSHDYLKKIYYKSGFIPLTTRSLDQYRRISFFEGCIPAYALVSNGGILLKNGLIVNEWYSESLLMFQNVKDEINKGKILLSNDNNIYFEIKIIDGLFLFTKSSNVNETKEKLIKEIDIEIVDIYENGDKIYIFPKKINKGNALRRLRKLFMQKEIICAGDSIMDVPMLLESDIAIYPESLKEYIISSKVQNSVSKEKLFSDELLQIVSRLI